MEVRARYTLMGIFTLAVLLMGFAFVYWLEAAGGLAERTAYRIRFSSPVAGLLKGSAVLFNGVRIGEVQSLALDAADPNAVVVEVAVQRSAPVRADTKATIDFQGLAGAPAISLVGGSPSLPLLAAGPAASRVLTAEKDAGQSLTEAGRNMLRRLDTVVAENAEPLKSTIASIDRFAAALARNSDKVDTILAGLERLTGGGAKPVVRVFDLSPARAFAFLKEVPTAQLLIPEPSALANLQSEKIFLAGTGTPSLENAQWPDVLPRVVQTRLLQSFENAGYANVLAGNAEGKRADVQLMVDLRRFQVVDGATRKAVVEVSARLVDKEGAILATKRLEAEESIGSPDVAPAAKALDDAFVTVASRLVEWACESIRSGLSGGTRLR